MKIHLLIISSIAVLLALSCKKSEPSNPLFGKWYISEAYFEPILPDGSPDLNHDPIHEDLDDPNFEGYLKRHEYFIDFKSNNVYQFGPHQSGTYSVEGRTISADLPNLTATYTYHIDGENLTLEGTQYDDIVILKTTIKLRRDL